MAILMRRTETVTRAPSLSSFRRMVPQVACASSVCGRPIRRKASSRTEANDENHSRSWFRCRGAVGPRVRPSAGPRTGSQIELAFLDPVLHFAAGTVDLFVEGLG